MCICTVLSHKLPPLNPYTYTGPHHDSKGQRQATITTIPPSRRPPRPPPHHHHRGLPPPPPFYQQPHLPAEAGIVLVPASFSLAESLAGGQGMCKYQAALPPSLPPSPPPTIHTCVLPASLQCVIDASTAYLACVLASLPILDLHMQITPTSPSLPLSLPPSLPPSLPSFPTP